MVEVTIEDLAITIRSSRESDKGGRRVCIEHDNTKVAEIQTSTGTEAIVLQGLGITMRSYAAAEKGDEEIALKILTRAEDETGGKDSVESHAHTKRKRTDKNIRRWLLHLINRHLAPHG